MRHRDSYAELKTPHLPRDIIVNNKKEDEIKTIDKPTRVSLKNKKTNKDKNDDGFVGDLFSLKTHVSNLKK